MPLPHTSLVKTTLHHTRKKKSDIEKSSHRFRGNAGNCTVLTKRKYCTMTVATGLSELNALILVNHKTQTLEAIAQFRTLTLPLLNLQDLY